MKTSTWMRPGGLPACNRSVCAGGGTAVFGMQTVAALYPFRQTDADLPVAPDAMVGEAR
ncbi:hypothetical protein NMQ14_09985 [Methyloversatilis sp. XJ19-13]|jgi:hypothetical protein|uniref:hypothetical protein n=1 Tax=Methyloversatilis sp. XJ19-13 TaxID=2963430 RepID=UPI00211BBD5E|nr:hypothetical protein [Methyloversatilis sp. XJ19-13]MCQ9374577.1 hypothetical protein [Methyloversatilis sp. XJ19-13]